MATTVIELNRSWQASIEKLGSIEVVVTTAAAIIALLM